jgi:Fe-S cluster assembly protein SufD
MSAHSSARDLRSEPLERVQRDFESTLAQLPESVIARSARRRAAEQLRQLGWPSVRDEQWRYAHLSAFERVHSFAPLAPTTTPQLPEALPAPLPGFERVLFIDGVTASPLPSSLKVQSGGAARAAGSVPLQPRWLEPTWLPEQRLALLNDMFALDAAVLRIEGQAALELLFVNSSGAAAVYPRLQLELAPGSELTLVERHLGGNESAQLVCAVVTAELARAARLTHYRLQQCGRETIFYDSLAARLHEEASYRVRQVQIGAAAARTSARVRLAGRGAALSWHAIAVGTDEQNNDCVLKVEHAAPASRTEEMFRGIADGRARVAFSGHIHIEAAAAGSEARQSLRGLIEGQGAVNLRPRLEINTDEVSAQHGATTGQLDENLLFYLLSRGIDRSTARTLLKWAFLNDVLRQIEQPQLRAEAEQGTAGQLQDVLAVGALA